MYRTVTGTESYTPIVTTTSGDSEDAASDQLVGIADARAAFSTLVDAASSGQRTLIGKHGKPVAALVPTHEAWPKDVLDALLRLAADTIAFDLSQVPNVAEMITRITTPPIQVPALPDDVIGILRHLWLSDPTGRSMANLEDSLLAGLKAQPDLPTAVVARQGITFLRATIAANLGVSVRAYRAKVTSTH